MPLTDLESNMWTILEDKTIEPHKKMDSLKSIIENIREDEGSPKSSIDAEKDGYSPLSWIINEYCHYKARPNGQKIHEATLPLFKLFISNGANVSRPLNMNSNYSILMFAVRHNNIDYLQELISVIIDLDFQGIRRKTALMIAAENGWDKSAEILLHAGANVELKDFKELTAHDIAKKNNHNSICELIEKHLVSKTKKIPELKFASPTNLEMKSLNINSIFSKLNVTVTEETIIDLKKIEFRMANSGTKVNADTVAFMLYNRPEDIVKKVKERIKIVDDDNLREIDELTLNALIEHGKKSSHKENVPLKL